MEPQLSNQLLSPPEFSAPVPSDSSPGQRIGMWLDLMRTCEKFLMAGLRRDIGSQGDIWAAYRKWYAQQCREHEQVVMRMLSELERREKRG